MDDLLPLDILVNHILLGLSVKCLLRCRCVCKQWHKLISGPEFTEIHIQRQKKHNQKVLCGPLWPRYEYEPSLKAYYGTFYSLDLESMSSPTLTRLPGFPLHDIKNDYELVQTLGYSNGMLCMLARQRRIHVRTRHIFFGNPSTGYYKILPDPVDDGPLICGFGYDSYVDDYKFVRVDCVTRNPHIFRLKSNSWTTNLWSSDKCKIGLAKNWISGSEVQEGTFIEGSIYWYVSWSNKVIVFNLRNEEFTDISCPRIFGKKVLKVLQGSLCIINTAFGSGSCDRAFVDMWWFVKDTWMKLMGVIMWWVKELCPLLLAEDGRILCCVEKGGCKLEPARVFEYALIHPHTGRSEEIDISETESSFFTNFKFRTQYSGYFHSLVSGNSSTSNT